MPLGLPRKPSRAAQDEAQGAQQTALTEAAEEATAAQNELK